MSRSARAIVDQHELTIDETARRVDGAVPTPEPLARHLVRLGIDSLGHAPRRVLDPACGAGSLLLAAAEELVRLGVPPAEVIRCRLAGVERDPHAAAAARRALVRWLADHDPSADAAPTIHVGDGLDTVANGPGPLAAGGADLVVANPPFLDQLDRRSRRSAAERQRVSDRFGPVGPYCDTAALFLAASLEQLRRGGVVSMLLPTSVLASRDAAAVRDRVVTGSQLVAVWGSGTRCVPAAVQVCAVVVRARRPEPARRVAVHWGMPASPTVTVEAPGRGATWGHLLAVADGIPAVPPLPGPPLRTVARVGAGFRDEYYAICAALGPEGPSAAPVVSVGMIDPLQHRRDERGWRVAGRRHHRPAVDLARLRNSSPRVAAWVAARRRPKVLVASQGRVIEAVADPTGAQVPLTPVISVEPSTRSVGPWALLAAVSAPPVAAALVGSRWGSGMSGRSARFSASDLAGVPLPVDPVAWAAGTELARRVQLAEGPSRTELLAEFAVTMCRAHGVDQREVLDWWWRHVAGAAVLPA